MIAIDSEFLFGQQVVVEQDPMFTEYQKRNELERMNEELRVCYVALTRARKLIMLGTEKPESKLNYRISRDANYISLYRWIKEIKENK